MFGNQNGAMGMGQQPTMQGYAYNGMPQPVQKFNNFLSADEIKMLQQKGDHFSLSLTQEELLRGICNHRNAEGTADTLVFDPLTGEARCVICGYKFRPIESETSLEDIKLDVSRIVDILQTIKLMYIDLPEEAAKQYFPIIPLIEKIPQLFEFAAKNMNKHEANTWMYNNRNMGAISMFNNLQNMFGSGMMMNGYQQQPMYGQQPMGQPGMMGGYPQFNQAPVGAMAPNNGFGYPGASAAPQPNPAFNPAAAGGYTPQTNGFAFTPNQQPQNPAPVAAPDAPKADGTATVTQNVTV